MVEADFVRFGVRNVLCPDLSHSIVAGSNSQVMGHRHLRWQPESRVPMYQSGPVIGPLARRWIIAVHIAVYCGELDYRGLELVYCGKTA